MSIISVADDPRQVFENIRMLRYGTNLAGPISLTLTAPEVLAYPLSKET